MSPSVSCLNIYHNNMLGKTTDTLILYHVQPEDSGFYRCSVSNNSGTVYSEYAALNITGI